MMYPPADSSCKKGTRYCTSTKDTDVMWDASIWRAVVEQRLIEQKQVFLIPALDGNTTGCCNRYFPPIESEIDKR